MVADYLNIGEDCFEDAKSFVPERWCEKPEMVRNRACFVPFGIGRFLSFR